MGEELCLLGEAERELHAYEALDLHHVHKGTKLRNRVQGVFLSHRPLIILGQVGPGVLHRRSPGLRFSGVAGGTVAGKFLISKFASPLSFVEIHALLQIGDCDLLILLDVPQCMECH